MWQFVKFSLATLVGIFLFLILGLFITIGIGSAMSGESEYEVKDNSILKLDLNRPMVENASIEEDDPFADIPNPFFSSTEKIGLIQILSAIERARIDPKVKGIYLDVSFPMAGYAQLSEIRAALQTFKASKKFIYSY
jgi:protease-4